MAEKIALTPEELREATEHRDLLLHLRAVLKTDSGRFFVKYLLKYQEAAQLPELGLEGPLLHDRLGSLRPGRALFKVVAEADFKIAAELLAEIEKERYDEIYANAQNGPS
jgi:hypothetical protein